MGDLISRSALITAIRESFCQAHHKPCIEDLEFLIEIVDDQPISYDVEKVIEKINKKSMKMSTAKPPHTYMRAIGTKEVEKIIREEINHG